MNASTYENIRPWHLIRSWLSYEESRTLETLILNKLSWQQPILSLYGKKNPIPRKTAFIADGGIIYRYSRFNHKSEDIPLWFRPLINKISKECNVQFNGCLLNYYRDGKDHMGWHSDDEVDLEKTKPIASLSIGTSRDFLFKHRAKPFKEILDLHEGDLLVMHPNCQKDWIHSLPIRRRVKEHRINLTFRCFSQN